MAKAAFTKAAGAAILAAMTAAAGMSAKAVAQESMEEAASGPPPCIVPMSIGDEGEPGRVTGEGLARGYACFEDRLLAGYAQSKHALAGLLSDWERTSEAPFIYDEVGERYLVVYANDLAIGEEETLWLDRNWPVGATLGIASFSLGAENQMIAEPLLIYEKLVQGYQFGRGNWRQTKIAPDGALMGVTKGPGADQLTVCQDCAARSADRLYLALLNDGVMPPDAPEPSAPIVENELGGPASDNSDGSALDIPSDAELEGLDGLDAGIPGAETFDPNPGVQSQELQPLDPLAPAQSLDPLDPLAPLDNAPPAPETPEAALEDGDTLDPLDPLGSESADDGSLDPLLPLEESDAGSEGQDMAAAPPTGAPADTVGTGPDTGSEDVMAEPSGAAASADLAGTERDSPTGLRPGSDSPLDQALQDATDPLLPVPPVTTVDLPPFLEEPGERL